MRRVSGEGEGAGEEWECGEGRGAAGEKDAGELRRPKQWWCPASWCSPLHT